MKSGKLILCSATAIVAVLAVGAGSASAACCSTWNDNGKAVAASDNTSMSITGTNTFRLEDGNLFGSLVVINCNSTSRATGAGTVGTGGSGTIMSFSATACTSNDPTECPNPVSLVAVSLGTTGWGTTIQTGTTSDLISPASGQANVGWKATCNGGVSDTCTSASSKATLSNNAGVMPAGVDMNFNGTVTPLLNCSIGGTGKGVIAGTLTVQLTNGDNLTVT
jgi:hypothetical protein